MSERDRMLTAHVEFELARWSGPQRPGQVRDAIGSAFAWLATVPLGDVLTAADVEPVVTQVLTGPITDELVDSLVDIVRGVRERALADDTALADLMQRETFDRYAGAVIGMKEARSFVTEQVTTSEVYSRLMAHVMYHGIKNYLVTESVIAKRVPGASSLMKLGQSALSSAAPSLERGIDERLTAFVNANISDSIRDSRQYLETVVDDDTLWTIADEIWQANSISTVADMAQLLSPEAADEFVLSAVDTWLDLRDSPAFADGVRSAVSGVLERNADRSLADVLADFGITSEVVADVADTTATPWLDRAVADGELERLIRARLEPFYDEYFG